MNLSKVADMAVAHLRYLGYSLIRESDIVAGVDGGDAIQISWDNQWALSLIEIGDGFSLLIREVDDRDLDPNFGVPVALVPEATLLDVFNQLTKVRQIQMDRDAV